MSESLVGVVTAAEVDGSFMVKREWGCVVCACVFTVCGSSFLFTNLRACARATITLTPFTRGWHVRFNYSSRCHIERYQSRNGIYNLVLQYIILNLYNPQEICKIFYGFFNRKYQSKPNETNRSYFGLYNYFMFMLQ